MYVMYVSIYQGKQHNIIINKYIESLICMYIYTAYHVSCRSDQFYVGTQQDSHEVLRLLLNKLQSEETEVKCLLYLLAIS